MRPPATVLPVYKWADVEEGKACVNQGGLKLKKKFNLLVCHMDGHSTVTCSSPDIRIAILHFLRGTESRYSLAKQYLDAFCASPFSFLFYFGYPTHVNRNATASRLITAQQSFLCARVHWHNHCRYFLPRNNFKDKAVQRDGSFALSSR